MLLIRPLCAGDEPEFAEPLGIERLAGYLREHGVTDVHVLDRRLAERERRMGLAEADAPGFYDELRALVAFAAEPQLVGLSLMTSADVPDARRIISRLGAWWPHARFVAGGVYVTTAPEEAARVLPRHVMLLEGEGEAQLLALVRGTAPEEGGHPFVTPDEWAVPFRPCVERYAALGCAVNLQSSRGCPGRCTFCATPQLPPALRRWQPRSMRLVVDELQEAAERLVRAGLPPVFNFVDDDFGPLSRLEELADELGRRELRVSFACEMRLRALIGASRLGERLTHLHEAGLTRVFVGVESLNTATLQAWHKPYDVGRLEELVTAFRSAGIALQCGYILWHAGQTVEGARDEVRELRRLGIYAHCMGLSRLIVFPGCERGDQPDAVMGYEPLEPRSERLLKRFAEVAHELGDEWTQAAIAEPYAAAEAFMTGDDQRLRALRETLDEVNDRSYELFERCVREAEA